MVLVIETEMKMADDLAMRIAKRILDEWSIGTSSRFCDDPPDFDYAEPEDIAAVIREVMAAAPTP